MPVADYDDDIVFEPEMSWEELRNFVKKQTNVYDDDNVIKLYGDEGGSITFRKDGDVYTNVTRLTTGRTLAQMKNILENLI